MRADRFRDDPWARLYWVGPLALLLTGVSQMGFLSLLSRPPATPAPRPVEVRLVELPPPRVSADRPAPKPPERIPAPRPKIPPPSPRSDALPPSPQPLAKTENPPEPMTPEPAQKQAALPVEEPSLPAPAAPRPEAPVSQGPAGPATASPVAPSRPAAEQAPVTSSPASPRSGLPDGKGLGGGKMGARAIYKPLPEIPEELRHQKIDVVAVARFRVAASGSAQVELIEPTGDPGLNRALLDSLRRWRFFPGMEEGKPVTSTIDIRIPISVK